MIALLFATVIANAATVCSIKAATPPEFEQIEKRIDEKIRKFANKPEEAMQADATLSQLIKAKSTLITNWMRTHASPASSEEDIARAWREYYARNFILSTYPHDERVINQDIENLVDSITNDFAKKAFQKRMQKNFEMAKAKALETVQTFSIEQKTKILDRIKSIKLYWPLNFKQARNNQTPLDIIAWGIAYDPPANEINMGVNAMAYPNYETYLAVFAHEIGHAFDSCRWSSYFNGPWPFEKVGACLRSDQGVNAKTRDDQFLARMVSEKRITAQLAKSLKENPTCNKLGYPPSGAQADQLPESFADWFSAEVMARTNLNNVDKLRLDLCDQRTLQPGSSYVANKTRLLNIYFSQPVLKAKLHDPALEKNTYCGL